MPQPRVWLWLNEGEEISSPSFVARETRRVLSKQKQRRRNTREERKRRESSLSTVALVRQWRLHHLVAVGRCLWPKGVSPCGHCSGSMG